jgi:hypothetical protein
MARKRRSKLSRAVTRARITLDRRPAAHFLHIGKTGGTAVKVAIRQAQSSSNYRVELRKHEIRLAAVPDDDYFFFCVRDPVSRYLSGFLSRQREGQPRYRIPWREDEAAAFGHFQSPDTLAVSLTAGGTEQEDAEAAMRAIRHVRDSYWDWFRDPDYFRSRADHILWVGHQEALELSPLAATLGFENLQLPTDPWEANRGPQAKPELSDLARANLRNWYARDYEFLDLCAEIIPTRGALAE